ncbi:class I adenylate-forming enzyme family protein [Actinocrispum wychmicini]|uniref:Acyl-CoA synthetase (AMP-forming)/AMP-acid ligase II n=1 Tax=Actinocrispum wychmicini TaxID=1213861 RepID=A0A4R2JX54_9PSEU|nr:fatty acid--CoA ligase family protein [Actinocrispum wychmicini]TCO61916.1 acyl-CoA synthetase (AMP-forming)/AMP-acid ligase II [Actinocrispum wychmicini]
MSHGGRGLRHYAREGEPYDDVQSTSLVAMLRKHAMSRGDEPAFRVYDGSTWEQATWREFGDLAAASAIRAANEFPAGRPALVQLDNSIVSLAALVGLAAAGVDLAVFEAESSLLRDDRSALHELGADTVVGTADVPSRYRVLPAGELTRPSTERDTLAAIARLENRNAAVWQSTSGSTGEPRLARQTIANLLRGGEIYTGRYHVTEQDTVVAAVPMAHSFGLVGGLMCALVSGAALTTFTRFSPHGLRAAVESGATIVLGTPLVYELTTRLARPATSDLRMALSSGGPLDPAVAESARQRLGCPVYPLYGSTEMGIIASQFPRTKPWPAGHVGVAAPGVELRLADHDDAASELLVRTSTMFTGYWGGDTDALDDQGWYRTGDLATIAADGTVTLVSRKDTFINVGGRKVNPARVERLIGGHTAVAEVAVYGVDAVGGQEVWAAVVLSKPCSVEELSAYCGCQLMAYEVPHRVHVMDWLPRNGMGKIDRGRLPRLA